MQLLCVFSFFESARQREAGEGGDLHLCCFHVAESKH